MFRQISDKCRELGVELRTTAQEFDSNEGRTAAELQRPDNRKFTFAARCGHDKTIFWHDWQARAKEWSAHDASVRKRIGPSFQADYCQKCSRSMSYQQMVDKLLSLGITVTSTREEYDSQNCYPSIRMVTVRADCGHVRMIQLHKLQVEKYWNQACNNCKHRTVVEVQQVQTARQGTNTQSIGGTGTRRVASMLAAAGMQAVEAEEGSNIDLLVRPKGSLQDCWLRIQVKTTEKAQMRLSGQAYALFQGLRGYRGQLVCCICLEGDLLWVIPGEKLESNMISCSVKQTTVRDQWGQYRATCEQLGKIVSEAMLNPLLTCSKDGQYESNHLRMQIFFAGARVRNSLFRAFAVRKPLVESTATDIIIHRQDGAEFWCQEKATMQKNLLQIKLCRTLGGVHCPYSVGDNHLYLFTIGNNIGIMTEAELVQQSALRSDHRPGKTAINSRSIPRWFSDNQEGRQRIEVFINSLPAPEPRVEDGGFVPRPATSAPEDAFLPPKKRCRYRVAVQ